VPDVLSPNSGGVRVPFKATRNSALKVELSQNETILTIMGKMIDEVKVLSQPLTTLNDLVQEYGDTFVYRGEKLENTEASENLLDEGEIFLRMEAYLEYFKEWPQHCIQIACPSGKVLASATRLEQFYRTLLWDVSNFITSIVMEPLSLEKCFLVSEYVSKITNSNLRDKPDKDWLDRMQFLTREVESPLGSLFNGRRFCSTADGHLGSLPRDAQAGYVICILYGGNMPYVLRPCSDGRYKFVGDCYLHGFMWGQAMDLDRETGFYLDLTFQYVHILSPFTKLLWIVGFDMLCIVVL